MNNALYRIVFNKTRGLMMAVAENTTSQGSARLSGSCVSHTTDSEHIGTAIELRALALVVFCVIGLQPVLSYAAVVADPAAQANNRPVIDATANGLSLVQITTPSAAGVSRNQYQQFNVEPAGVILNNSQGVVQTQQGGYVSGNPYLARGSARIILNEVTGAGASLLRGYTEVAGQRAEVIIANPNGITCNGCGFINTSRGVLTTGIPVMGGSGSLDAFRVSGGQIDIGGAGLNGSNTDQLDLIARSVKVNAELWGNDLNVVSGANLVNYASLGVQVILGESNQPTVGIDVALLGGMYANKIHLVGTEAGVGVNSLGNFAAQAGDLNIDSQGKVTLSGNTSATGSIIINGNEGVTNSGLLYSQLNARLDSAGDINNSGFIAAQGSLVLTGANVHSGGGLGAGVNARGIVTQNASLSVMSSGRIDDAGQNLAGGDIVLNGTNLNLANSRTGAGGNVSLAATAGSIDLTQATLQTNGALVLNTVAGITNDLGTIAGSQFTAHAASISNQSGLIEASNGLVLRGLSLSNAGGVIQNVGAAALDISLAGSLVNTGMNGAGGLIGGNGQVNIAAASLDNTGGIIGGNGNVEINTGDLLNTQAGQFISGGNLALNVSRSLDNSGGMLYSAGMLTLAKINPSTGLVQTPPIVNATGNISANGDISLNASSIDNSNGVIANLANGGGSTTLAASGDLTNTGGKIGSDLDLLITANTLIGNGQAVAGRDTVIDLQGNYTYSAGNQIASNRNLSFTTAGDFTNTGILQSVNELTLCAANITNQGALNAWGRLGASTGILSNTGSIIGGDVTIAATRLIENAGVSAFIGASNAAGLMELLAPTIQNRDDTTATDSLAQTTVYGLGNVILAGGKDGAGQYTHASQILNQSGLIQSGGDLTVYADTLTNTRRMLQMNSTFTQVGVPVTATGNWYADNTIPGGQPANWNIGGAVNSSYMYTAYTTTITRNSPSNISYHP